MTSTFLLPLAMGACTAVGGNVVTDAFGIVALVALAPLIAIQVMGLVYARKTKAARQPSYVLSEDTVIDLDDEIVDLEEMDDASTNSGDGVDKFDGEDMNWENTVIDLEGELL